MILSYLNDIELKKNILLNSYHNASCNVKNFDFYQAILNECKNNLLSQEIKFDNISTKSKKKNDENITSINFLVNNLLNVFNKENIKSSFYAQKNTEIKKQKKKLDKNIKLKSYFSLKNKNRINIEDNIKKNKIFQNDEILKSSINTKKNFFLFHNYNIISYFKKFYNKSKLSDIKNLKVIKNKKSSIKDNKNFFYFKNHLNNTSNFPVSKNIYKTQNTIFEVNSLKKVDENNFFKLNNKSIFISNNKINLQWKKAISQQVLLSIVNKENKAEIHLKPVLLGAIYVEIKIKDNQVKLKFISDHTEVKNFLNHCIPFLRDSLTKNSIFLKKVIVSSSFNSKKYKNLFIFQNTPKTSNKIKEFHKNLTKKKFVDMYI